MLLYRYDGQFNRDAFTNQSIKFKTVIRNLNCDKQQTYDLFSGFVELFQNITLHAAHKPIDKQETSTAGITLLHLGEKTFILQSKNLIAADKVDYLREKFSSLSTLKKANEKAVMGLYILNKCSGQTLTNTVEDSVYRDFKTLTLTTSIT